MPKMGYHSYGNGQPNSSRNVQNERKEKVAEAIGATADQCPVMFAPPLPGPQFVYVFPSAPPVNLADLVKNAKAPQQKKNKLSAEAEAKQRFYYAHPNGDWKSGKRNKSDGASRGSKPLKSSGTETTSANSKKEKSKSKNSVGCVLRYPDQSKVPIYLDGTVGNPYFGEDFDEKEDARNKEWEKLMKTKNPVIIPTFHNCCFYNYCCSSRSSAPGSPPQSETPADSPGSESEPELPKAKHGKKRSDYTKYASYGYSSSKYKKSGTGQ